MTESALSIPTCTNIKYSKNGLESRFKRKDSLEVYIVDELRSSALRFNAAQLRSNPPDLLTKKEFDLVIFIGYISARVFRVSFVKHS